MGLLKELFNKTKSKTSNQISIQVSFQESVNTSSNIFNDISNKEELFNATHPLTYTEFINYSYNYKLSDKQKIIALLNWCSKSNYPIKENDNYPQWITYRLKINDINTFHKKLIKTGYLEKTNIDFSLSKLTIKELKEILEKNNISVKGKKSDYVNAILNSVDIDSLQLISYYQLSNKGKELLSTKDSKEFIVAFENRYGVSIAEFYNVKQYLTEYATPNDVLWQTLTAKYDYEKLNNRFSLARNELLNQAYLLQDEGKYVAALEHYIYIAYYDLSGCHNNCITKKEDSLIAPAIVELIKNHKDYYTDKIIDRCKTLGLPYHYYSINEFNTIIKSIMDDSEYYKQFSM